MARSTTTTGYEKPRAEFTPLTDNTKRDSFFFDKEHLQQMLAPFPREEDGWIPALAVCGINGVQHVKDHGRRDAAEIFYVSEDEQYGFTKILSRAQVPERLENVPVVEWVNEDSLQKEPPSWLLEAAEQSLEAHRKLETPTWTPSQ